MDRSWWMVLAGAGALVAACGAPKTADDVAAAPPPIPEAVTREATFEEDVAFLGQYGTIETLVRPDGGRIAVSPKYQGRVMTSAVAPGGESLGWVNRALIQSGKTGTAFDNYGGEDRFWLGPEGGQFGLYFPPGKPFTFANWQTPHALQEGEWKVASHTPESIELTQSLELKNWSGTTFDLDVVRTITLLDGVAVQRRFGIKPQSGKIPWVAYETSNRIVNTGTEAWTPEKGLLSIWILGQFAPASDAHIVIPLDPEGSGPAVKDDYFGTVPRDRLTVKPGYVVFNADGRLRSKIGVGPSHARSVAGAYSPGKGVLTIVQFNRQYEGTKYVNSAWEKQDAPYTGDIINAYNDGPVAPGEPSLGGFFEIETSSPAAALGPGATAIHVHRTIHFLGTKQVLDPIAHQLLGISLDDLSR